MSAECITDDFLGLVDCCRQETPVLQGEDGKEVRVCCNPMAPVLSSVGLYRNGICLWKIGMDYVGHAGDLQLTLDCCVRDEQGNLCHVQYSDDGLVRGRAWYMEEKQGISRVGDSDVPVGLDNDTWKRGIDFGRVLGQLITAENGNVGFVPENLFKPLKLVWAEEGSGN